ncbi:MAG: hypothetical protein RR588_16280, partial [Solibacillus sp.]
KFTFPNDGMCMQGQNIVDFSYVGIFLNGIFMLQCCYREVYLNLIMIIYEKIAWIDKTMHKIIQEN